MSRGSGCATPPPDCLVPSQVPHENPTSFGMFPAHSRGRKILCPLESVLHTPLRIFLLAPPPVFLGYALVRPGSATHPPMPVSWEPSELRVVRPWMCAPCNPSLPPSQRGRPSQNEFPLGLDCLVSCESVAFIFSEESNLGMISFFPAVLGNCRLWILHFFFFLLCLLLFFSEVWFFNETSPRPGARFAFFPSRCSGQKYPMPYVWCLHRFHPSRTQTPRHPRGICLFFFLRRICN